MPRILVMCASTAATDVPLDPVFACWWWWCGQTHTPEEETWRKAAFSKNGRPDRHAGVRTDGHARDT